MRSFYIKLLSIILISCLGVLVYSNTFFCPFQFDDFSSIVNNPFIKNIHQLQNTWNFLPRRSVLYFTFALNYYFNGLNVLGYHLFNLTVHLVSAILVWWLVLLTFSTPAMKETKITRHSNLIALFAGLVFVSHPVQTEAVTYIVQRAASMATLFYLASLGLYVKSRLLEDQKSRYYYMGSLAAAVVAMFTKEIAITLPLMVLLYEFFFLKTKKEFNWRRLTPFLLTLFIIPLTMLFTESVKSQEIRGFSPEDPSGLISPIHYLLTQFRVMCTYIRLLFLPLNQNLDYDYPVSKGILELPVLFSSLFLIIVLFSARRLFSKYKLVSFSILWFFLTLLPESSVMPIRDVIYEHRLYLPLAGYSMFLASSVYYLWGKNSIKTMVIVLSLIIASNSVLTYERNGVWRDAFTLWDDVIQKSPNKARPYNNRGIAWAGHGNFIQAMSDFNKAIEINPNYADAYYNRGNTYKDRGKFPQAIIDYNRTIEINPDYATAYNNRGFALYRQGRRTQAISDLDKAIELNPDFAEAYNNRALVYYKLKEYSNARADMHKAQTLGCPVNPYFVHDLQEN